MTSLKSRHLYLAAATAALAGAAVAIPAWADSNGHARTSQGEVASAPAPATPPPRGVGFVGSAGEGPPSGAEVRRARAKLDKFVRCMREHGADVPGVQTKGSGVSVRLPAPKTRRVIKQVARKCGMPPPPPRDQLFPLDKKQIEQNRQALDDFVNCTRVNGDLPDPAAQQRGFVIPVRPGSAASEFAKAEEKCGGPPQPPSLPPRS
jgi:hypothetical protein